jgi:hypothetical protein
VLLLVAVVLPLPLPLLVVYSLLVSHRNVCTLTPDDALY